MSINDVMDSLQVIARASAFEAKALAGCRLHSDSVVYRGDPAADRLAYAIATNAGKAAGYEDWLQDVSEAVKQELVDAADECPECSRHRYDRWLSFPAAAPTTVGNAVRVMQIATGEVEEQYEPEPVERPKNPLPSRWGSSAAGAVLVRRPVS